MVTSGVCVCVWGRGGWFTIAARSLTFFFSEGFQSWMWKGLTFLLPFLFFGHVSLAMT